MQYKNIHIIVQAGGKGTRLRHHTWNKPKCLVSLYGKPLLYHLFDTFNGSKFSIIGDYHFEKLEEYLSLFPPKISYELVRARMNGTLAGIKTAIKNIPKDDPCLIIWSDIFIEKIPVFSSTSKPVLGITDSFLCRWRVLPNGQLDESPGISQGVAGLFLFPKSRLLNEVPEEGEFVEWFAGHFNNFETVDCPSIAEVGDFTSIEILNGGKAFCRFFNNVTINQDRVTKTAIDSDFSSLIEKEVQWYREAKRIGFKKIPKVISTNPLILERINGHHLFEMTQLNQREKSAALVNHLEALLDLHERDKSVVDLDDIKRVYIDKTIQRVQSVSSLIPQFHEREININGKKCRNIFSHDPIDYLTSLINKIKFDYFCPIHGDPTFSNTLIDKYLRAWFIDPRGYYYKAGIMGDPLYDFAKVYYSAVGGYDNFNRKKFKLYINGNTVEILTEKPILSDLAEPIFKEYFSDQLIEIKILHALIWLSFSGYVRDDIDSVIGAFYSGIYWLEDTISYQNKNG